MLCCRVTAYSPLSYSNRSLAPVFCFWVKRKSSVLSLRLLSDFQQILQRRNIILLRHSGCDGLNISVFLFAVGEDQVCRYR